MDNQNNTNSPNFPPPNPSPVPNTPPSPFDIPQPAAPTPSSWPPISSNYISSNADTTINPNPQPVIPSAVNQPPIQPEAIDPSPFAPVASPVWPANSSPTSVPQSNPWDFLSSNNTVPSDQPAEPVTTWTPPLPQTPPTPSIPTPPSNSPSWPSVSTPSTNQQNTNPWSNLNITDSPAAPNSPLPEQTPPAPSLPTPQEDPLAPASTPSWIPNPSSPTPQNQSEPVTPPAPAQHTNTANLSHLDNPWGAPMQPPPIDGSGSTVQPAWIANIHNSQNPPSNDTPNTPPVPESAPTDLSHLITNINQETNNKPAPETLVAPTITPTADTPTMASTEHKGIPVWLIGIGIGLLILVIAASAYFILGTGQSKATTSIPATIASQTNEGQNSNTTPPTNLQPSAQPAATGSASFGDLQNTNNNATSAADLLRQRQNN